MLYWLAAMGLARISKGQAPRFRLPRSPGSSSDLNNPPLI